MGSDRVCYAHMYFKHCILGAVGEKLNYREHAWNCVFIHVFQSLFGGMRNAYGGEE